MYLQIQCELANTHITTPTHSIVAVHVHVVIEALFLFNLVMIDVLYLLHISMTLLAPHFVISFTIIGK